MLQCVAKYTLAAMNTRGGPTQVKSIPAFQYPHYHTT